MEIDRPGRPKHEAVVEVELLLQKRYEPVGCARGDFQPHGVGLALLGYLLGNFFEQVVGVFLVDVQFAVAGDAERGPSRGPRSRGTVR